ncbi:MAG: FAD:protein FMN transferase [Alphaproteobacteria bacterium]|nr:FAD:protein FMN transferase [Alphaproteobacteria bacterium]
MTMTRRKFLVTAVAAGSVGGLGALIASGDARPGLVWRGSAMGGEARVSLYGADTDAARSALGAVANEIERLEDIFSLHRETSELRRLNRDGRIESASRDLADLIGSALRWREATGGAFDPTVQPLWQAAADGIAPTPELVAKTGAAVAIGGAAISIPPGAGLTLNGIAQGRIADRVTELLLAHGFNDVVVDAGELRLPGKERRAVGIPAAKAAVSVAEVAIATSEPKTLVFDHNSWRHHLIDPRTGASPRHWESISVFAPTAEAADALSTAFAVLPQEAVADLTSTIGDIAVIGADGKGRVRRFGDLSLTGARTATS